MLYSRTAWEDYFPDTRSKEFNTRQAPSVVYVLDCLFNCIKSTSNGGALHCTTNYLLVESSSFFSCNTTNINGGAIYFSNANSGECVLHEVCGNDCRSTCTNGISRGLFAYIIVRNAASSKNYINYSSILRCRNDNFDSRQTVHLENGKICCQSINASMNKCYYRSGFIYYPFIDPNSATCSLLYSSFTDNNDLICNCIFLYVSNAKYEIKYCNILRNTQGSVGAEGTIFTYGNLMIEDCCILENTATTIFYSYYSTHKITLSNSTVDKTTNNGCLTIQKTATKSFIHALNHILTQNCHAEYDSAGGLTANPYLSRPTKKTISNYNNTCKNNDYHSIISDFFSLICVFIMTFIYSLY
jgi:hypothetical protein